MAFPALYTGQARVSCGGGNRCALVRGGSTSNAARIACSCHYRRSRQAYRGYTHTERGDPNAASSYVRPVDDTAQSFVLGVVVPPGDVPADHAGPFLVAGVVGAVERKVAEGGEPRFYAV